jgi:hypothetical protein
MSDPFATLREGKPPSAIEVADNLSSICERFDEPLTETQKLAMYGALAVWIEKAFYAGQCSLYQQVKPK